MRAPTIMGIAFCLAFATGVSAAPLFGPKGSFSTLFSSLKYDPSRACSKPYRSSSMDQYAKQRYLNEAEYYLQCLKDASNGDVRYASEVIAEGYKEARAEFLSEVESGY